MKLGSIILLIVFLHINVYATVVTQRGMDWVQLKKDVCPLPLQGQNFFSRVYDEIGIASGPSCVSLCMQLAFSGEVLPLISYMTTQKLCRCFMRELDVATGTSQTGCPTDIRSSALIINHSTWIHFIPRYVHAVEVGEDQLEPDVVNTKANYLLKTEFKNFVTTNFQKGQQSSRVTASGWYAAPKGADPVNKRTRGSIVQSQQNVLDFHLAKTGPKMSQVMSVTIVTDSSTPAGIYDSFFKPMANLYLKMNRRDKDYLIDRRVRVAKDCCQPIFQCTTETSERMIKSPQFFTATFYDRAKGSIKVLASMIIVNEDAKLLIAALPKPVPPVCNIAEALGAYSTVLSIPGSFEPVTGAFSTAFGIVSFILGKRCEKKSSLKEFTPTTILENKIEFCNETFNYRTELPAEDQEMCNRLLWAPKQWFSQKK